MNSSANEPIAIVEIGCRFPSGATTPHRFRELLKEGVDTIPSSASCSSARGRKHAEAEEGHLEELSELRAAVSAIQIQGARLPAGVLVLSDLEAPAKP